MCYWHSTPIAVHDIGPNDPPIIAYKALDVRGSGCAGDGPHFYSRLAKRVWHRNQMLMRNHPVAGRAATGDPRRWGTFCFKNWQAARVYRRRNGSDVIVKLELRGRVYEHAGTSSGGYYGTNPGYRAQRAKIVAVWVVPRRGEGTIAAKLLPPEAIKTLGR